MSHSPHRFGVVALVLTGVMLRCRCGPWGKDAQLIQFNLSPIAMIGPIGRAALFVKDVALSPLPHLVAGMTGEESHFTDAGGTTSAAIGDPVWVAQTGTGPDMAASAADARPILRRDGALSYLAFDGVDDHISTALDAISLSAGATVGLLVRTTDTQAIVLADRTDNNRYIGDIEAGAAIELGRYGGTGGTTLVEGTVCSGTRDDFYTAVCTGSWTKIIVSGANLAGWRRFGISAHQSELFRFSGDVAAAFVLSGATSEITAEADERLDTLKELAA
jgi:hypothetical protein